MRLILADDHTLIRAGIRALLDRIDDVTTVAETGDGREALELIEKHRPDLALLDITMPGLNGLEIASRLGSVSPSTKVIVLSVHATEQFVAKALRSGVSGYLLKDSAATELEVAIQAVAGGKTYLSPAISMRVVEGYLQHLDAGKPTDALGALSVRQREILQLIAEGKTTREIAGLLDISVKTVEGHRAQLMDKLDIRDVPGLVRLAIREGLVSPDG
jgi:DNA-binding NarL/FixJ family response regulator